MKTLLFLYHTSSIGGGSYCLLNILKSIDRAQFTPVVLLNAYGPLVDEINALGISVHYLKELITVPYNRSTFTPKSIRNALTIISGLRKFRKILDIIKPDIVYVNTMMLYPFLKPAKEHGAKTVIHIREHWPDCEHIFQRKIATFNIDKYSDYIVAINTFSLSMFDFSEKPKSIIYDWIDLSNRFEECPLSKVFKESIDGKRIFLYLGGLQQIKGSLEVATAFSEVIRDKNSRLLMMGIKDYSSYNLGCKGKIKRLLKILGYSTYSQKVFDVIEKDNRIKCLPSRYKINHIVQQTYCILSYFTIPHANLALAESIILGIPTIAAKTEESIEYSLNGRLSSLFEINNIADFKNKLANIDKNYNDLKKRIELGSKSIENLFDPQRNSILLNNILNTI